MTDWQRLFPDEDFRFRMGLRPGDAASFFEPVHHCTILDQRAAALASHPERYAAALPDSLPVVDEALRQMSRWSGVPQPQVCAGPGEHCLAAGRAFEPDWVLLSPDASQNHPVLAGVVCFPSSWSLPEKLGLPLAAVHEPAPTVNRRLGGSIDTFLSRLPADEPVERENWGLAADAAPDHHPAIPRPRLSAQAKPATTWLRLERQLLIRLPETRAVLFAIRITVHRLDEVAAATGLGARIARALRTMPPDIAAYKGLETSRLVLAEELAHLEARPSTQL